MALLFALFTLIGVIHNYAFESEANDFCTQKGLSLDKVNPGNNKVICSGMLYEYYCYDLKVYDEWKDYHYEWTCEWRRI